MARAACSAAGRSSWSSRTTPARRKRASPGSESWRRRTRSARSIGQFHSSVMEAVQDLAEQLKIPVFSTQASAKRITEKHLTYTFRTHVIDPDRVQIWNRFIQQQGFKRVAIIAENTDYGIGLSDETKKQFASSGIKAELKSIIFDRAVVDLTPQLLEIKNWKPDLVINVGRGHAGVPDHQAGLRRRPVPRDAHAGLLRHAGPAGVLEEPGRQGHLHDVHRLLSSDHEAHAARGGLPHPVPRGVQGGAGLRRAQRLCPDHADRRRHQPREERQAGRHREGAPRQQVHGLERHHQLHARRGPVLAAVDAADAVHAVHEGRACPSPRPRSSSRPI